MNNFEFEIPTKIKFGENALSFLPSLTEEFCKLGNKVLVLYGSDRVRKNGLYRELENALRERGFDCIPFGGIMENPILSTVEEAIRVAREEGVAMILAIGGGSVIDSAKAIALGCCYDGPVWDFYDGKQSAAEALPLGVVLTMAATASEANGVSVIWNKEINVKKALTEPLTRPAFALLNPKLTGTVPASVTAAGAIDIFAHAFERYIDLEEENTLRNHLCEAVMLTVAEVLPKTLAEPDSYEYRSQLMWAATVAHSNMIGFHGDYACHALSHVLTACFGISHGMGLGMLMPAWCRYMLQIQPEGIRKLFEAVWVNWKGNGTEGSIQDGIQEFEAFVRACGCPVNLREAKPDLSVDEIDLDALVKKAIPTEGGFIGGGYRKLYRGDVRAILEMLIPSEPLE